MASLQHRGGSWRVLFRYKRRLHAFPIGNVDEAEAHATKGKVEYLLMRVKQRLLTVPSGMDICKFLLHDGKPPDTTPDALPEITLGELRDRYLGTHRRSLEANTVVTIELHFRHIVACLKESFPVATLTLADLQKYVTGRENKVQPGTIKMELISLRTAWNWGAAFGLVEGKFPNKGLRFPKSKEKPPFMTWDEVERRAAQGGNAKELWDCLYLTPAQSAEMLEEVKRRAIQPWVHPMVAFAAHTGARRSEISRVRTEDVDFAQGVVTIREKKRRRGVDSTRRVPMSTLLAKTLKEYLDERPPFHMLFRQEARVVRSKKKRTAVAPVTLHEAQNHFKRTLAGTKWSVVRGWHVLRHSMISALANRGVDQRVIQDMVGHMTAEMQRRYAHLYPSTKQDAIRLVFG